jgi:ribosome-associated heat shock protein Hsp15
LAGPPGKVPLSAAPKLRLDKWLWQARFTKSRSLASALIEAGFVRLNGARVTRPGRDVTLGDVLIFPQGSRIRVVRILALGIRRGPAPEAQALYLDLEPPTPASDPLE